MQTNVVCVGNSNSIQLSNATIGGVWSVNNSNVTISNPTANPVTITAGATTGETYVTYTISNGSCESKKTFLLKILPANAPELKI